MYCHDLKVMGSNPGLVELGVCSTFVQGVLKQNTCRFIFAVKIAPVAELNAI